MDILIAILADGALAAVAAIGFGAISDPSLRSVPFIALLAAVAHAVRFSLMTYAGTDIVTASLAGALCAGFLSLWAGRRCRTPMTCLFIPALLPMVPGMYAYRAVFALIMFVQSLDSPALMHDYLMKFASNLSVTVMVICVLAGGASLPNFLFKKLAFSMTRSRNAAASKQ